MVNVHLVQGGTQIERYYDQEDEKVAALKRFHSVWTHALPAEAAHYGYDYYKVEH